MTATGAVPPLVTLDHWLHHRVTAGDTIDRWTLSYEGRALVTRGTELEVRRIAKAYGWQVVRAEEVAP